MRYVCGVVLECMVFCVCIVCFIVYLVYMCVMVSVYNEFSVYDECVCDVCMHVVIHY